VVLFREGKGFHEAIWRPELPRTTCQDWYSELAAYYKQSRGLEHNALGGTLCERGRLIHTSF
jgi:hypothetical protein